MSLTKDGTVKATGAKAGDLLIGMNPLNMGLQIKITKDQKVDRGGRVLGEFTILEAGTGNYSQYITKLEGNKFETAKDFIEQVQRMSGTTCSMIVNCNNLRVSR